MKKMFLPLFLGIISLSTVAAQPQSSNKGLRPNTHYQATFQTSAGNFTVELHNETPVHRDNFIKLSESDFYKGILFHRVIKNFVIQAGDPSSKEGLEVVTYGGKDAGYRLEAEIIPELFHRRGALAAARDANDKTNPERESSSSQFYVVTGVIYSDSTILELKERLQARGNEMLTPERERVYMSEGGLPILDGEYTIFGQVIKGQAVVDKIGSLPTYSNDRPKTDIYIKKIKIKVVSDKRKR